MKLSKSKINSYLKCPLEFKFQYIDEIEAEPNKYMALGSDVHLIAEKFAEKFGDELDDVDIENELLKIAYDLDFGYDLSNHIENLGDFFKEVFVDNDYKLYSQEEYLIDEEHRFSGICDIILEDDAYIGANAVIMPGVKIGKGAVVGANSLVTNNCKPWGIYFGNPAKRIGEREKPSDDKQRIIATMYWEKHF